MKGKLIIIEGIDGSGKTTQTRLLIEQLRKKGKKVKSIHFPQHGQEVFGNLVDAYLQGEFGPAPKIDYRLASTLYALDRFEAKSKIERWLKSGHWVVLDRYAESNFGHQGGKIKNIKKQCQVLKWLYNLDYVVLKNPKPDLVLFLNVPVKEVIRLLDKTGKAKDEHEKDVNFLKNSRQAYLLACQNFKYWKNINCVENGQLLSIEKIHQKIWGIIKRLNIKRR
ncbi:MAG TPA: dTMP kinase [Patescibacteria group bacterium]|nr:dTMP kinase [Patescibacteria group bacterium]